MIKKPTLIDLFAGCGGLSLGLEQAGFKTVFANDINALCATTYIQNFNIEPQAFFLGDVKDLLFKVKSGSIGFKDIDIVAGGPPCQGFSIANRQPIIDDPRNQLYKSFLEFLKLVRPKFFLMENVKGMAQKTDEILLNYHNTLGSEYNLSSSILNSKWYGVPQNRERFFIIGNRLGVDSENIVRHLTKPFVSTFNLHDAISDLPVLKAKTVKNNTTIENEDVGFVKKEHKYKRTEFYNFVNNSREVKYLYNHKSRYNNDRDIEIFTRLPESGNSLHKSIEDIMPYKSRNNIFKDKYYKLPYQEPCRTITSHMQFDCNMYIHPTQARGLSPREAARIQTFPDDFVFYGPQNKWYMQIGNAVPVKMAYAIGKEIIKWL